MKTQPQIDRLLAQRAAEWIEILKSGREADRREFVLWLRQSKLHVAHFLEMTQLDRDLQSLRSGRFSDIDDLLRNIEPNVVTLDRATSKPVEPVVNSIGSRKWRWIGTGLAASLLVGLLITGIAGLPPFHPRISTAAGEQRTMALSDGSVVALNVASHIVVDFSKAERGIELRHGEALFKVAHDKTRPFIVRTRTARVQAVGTQFNVNERADGTFVSVLEGRVQIIAATAGTASTATKLPSPDYLSAGEEAIVHADGTIEHRTHADVSRSLAWRQRRLVYDSVPLEDIIRDFGRYDPSLQITLEGIAPGSRRYGGVFDADDPKSFVDTLTKESDLTIERRGAEIVIKRRP